MRVKTSLAHLASKITNLGIFFIDQIKPLKGQYTRTPIGPVKNKRARKSFNSLSVSLTASSSDSGVLAKTAAQSNIPQIIPSGIAGLSQTESRAPIQNSTAFSKPEGGTREARPTDFPPFFQTNSEFLARWRALFFRQGGGSKSEAILTHSICFDTKRIFAILNLPPPKIAYFNDHLWFHFEQS